MFRAHHRTQTIFAALDLPEPPATDLTTTGD
jgi:hypothetical protein